MAINTTPANVYPEKRGLSTLSFKALAQARAATAKNFKLFSKNGRKVIAERLKGKACEGHGGYDQWVLYVVNL